MIVDANNLVLGRMATHVAKELLRGEKVEIVNCDKVVVSGSKEYLIPMYTHKTKRGEPFHGPFYPRREDMLVRRAIRGMLPWKEARGQAVFRNLMCYIGVPEELNGKKFETFKDAHVSRLRKTGHMKMKDISKSMGKRI